MTAPIPPLTVEVWTQDYVRRGVVARPLAASGTIAHNGPGTFEFTVDADHPRVADLTADGARAVVLYRAPLTTGPAAPVALISGTLKDISGTGPRDAATRTFTIRDDWNVLNEIIGFPNPTGTLAQQGDDGAYFTATGPAETVLKNIVGPNRTRQGVTLAIPASLGRGATCTVSVRMHPLADRLFPTIDQAGIGVRVIQLGATRTLDVYVPVTRTRVLTEASGTVVDGEFSLSQPAVTRVVVGAGGEGTARVFREYVSNGAGGVIANPSGLVGIESTLKVSRSVFVDARDVEPTDPNLETTLQARALETLTEGAARVSLRVVLAETDNFRFGRSFNVGDRVSVQLAGSPVLSDHVREVQLAYTVDDGLLTTPTVGDWSESASDALYRSVAVLARALRDSQRR